MKSETRFAKDVRQQPESMRQALAFYEEEQVFEKVRRLAQKQYDKIVMTGMGSSYAACMNAGAILRNAGFNAFTEVSSDLLHYHTEMLTENTLLVLVSQSGQSGEILDLCAAAPASATVVAVTNDPTCALAKHAELTLVMHVTPEDIVSTRSYLASQILMLLFARAFTGAAEEETLQDLRQSLVYLSEAVDDFDEMQQQMREYMGVPAYINLIARGWSVATAEGGALFIKEGAKMPSIAFEAAQFRHGPIELVTEGFAALVFIPKGRCEEMQLRIAEEICQYGGKVVVVAEEGVELPRLSAMTVIRQHYVSQELAPLVNIVPVQAFIDYVSKDSGIDSGSFRCGSKVTVKQ